MTKPRKTKPCPKGKRHRWYAWRCMNCGVHQAQVVYAKGRRE